MEVTNGKSITQEGPDLTVGESLGASAPSPYVSGRGTNCDALGDRAGVTGVVTRSKASEASRSAQGGKVVPETSRSAPGMEPRVLEKSIPVQRELRVRTPLLSEVDSDSSMASVSSGTEESRQRRKRSAGLESVLSSPKGAAHKSKRCRGRPPTPSAFASSWRLDTVKNDGSRLEAEECVAALDKSLKDSRQACRFALDPPSANENTPESMAALIKLMTDAAINVEKVVAASSNLKGTSIKALKAAAATVKEAAAGMRARTITEEVAHLEAANAALSSQVAELRKEVAEMRSQSVAVASPAPRDAALKDLLEEVSRANIAQLGAMLNARFEGIEDRLLPERRLRPLLAADRRREEAEAAAQAVAGTNSQQSSGSRIPLDSLTKPLGASSMLAQPVNGKSNGRGRKSLAAKEKEAAMAAREATKVTEEPSAPKPSPPPTWSEVTRRKPKAGERVAAAVERPASFKNVLKLQAPRSAAVTLTLLPGALEKGITYHTVMTEARTRVDYESIGITELRSRTTVTGARMLEVHGEAGAAKADSLALKLREVLSAEVVRVSRPEKRVDIRVSELDDSVTAAEVVAAVSARGGCTGESIRAGAMSGRGSIWLSCPVAAVKAILSAGRLRVGWVSAKVTLLDARPLRCFKCLETGHVGCRCSSLVDRSGLCYRCGKSDHVARTCSAEPNCPVCAAGGKPAVHTLGGVGCSSGARQHSRGSKKKRRNKRKAEAVAQPSPAQRPEAGAQQEEPMETVI